MGLASGSRQVSRAVSDASGLSQEEAGLLVAGAAVSAVLLGALRVMDFVRYLFPPAPPPRKTGMADAGHRGSP